MANRALNGRDRVREEENYYFKLSQHKEWLPRPSTARGIGILPMKHWLEANATWQSFPIFAVELRNAVEKINDNRQSGSTSRISFRPKSRLDWGIELPFDKDFVTTWFDALTNYISLPATTQRERCSHRPATGRDRWQPK